MLPSSVDGRERGKTQREDGGEGGGGRGRQRGRRRDKQETVTVRDIERWGRGGVIREELQSVLCEVEF